MFRARGIFVRSVYPVFVFGNGCQLAPPSELTLGSFVYDGAEVFLEEWLLMSEDSDVTCISFALFKHKRCELVLVSEDRT